MGTREWRSCAAHCGESLGRPSRSGSTTIVAITARLHRYCIRNDLWPMHDFLTPGDRSRRMAQIRSTDTKLERRFCQSVGRQIHREGYRYRKHYARLPGKPDLAFPKYRVAVFIDSSFWHGANLAGWERKLRKRYWREKIKGNVARDRRNNRAIRRRGWTVVRFWDGEIRRRPWLCYRRLAQALRSSKSALLNFVDAAA